MGDSEEDYGWWIPQDEERGRMEGIVEAKKFSDDGKKMTLALKTSEGSRMYGVWLKDKVGGDTKLAFLKATNAGDSLDFSFKTREYQGKTYYDITDVGRHEAHKDTVLADGGLNSTAC